MYTLMTLRVNYPSLAKTVNDTWHPKQIKDTNKFSILEKKWIAIFESDGTISTIQKNKILISGQKLRTMWKNSTNPYNSNTILLLKNVSSIYFLFSQNDRIILE